MFPIATLPSTLHHLPWGNSVKATASAAKALRALMGTDNPGLHLGVGAQRWRSVAPETVDIHPTRVALSHQTVGQIFADGTAVLLVPCAGGARAQPFPLALPSISPYPVKARLLQEAADLLRGRTPTLALHAGELSHDRPAAPWALLGPCPQDPLQPSMATVLDALVTAIIAPFLRPAINTLTARLDHVTLDLTLTSAKPTASGGWQRATLHVTMSALAYLPSPLHERLQAWLDTVVCAWQRTHPHALLGQGAPLHNEALLMEPLVLAAIKKPWTTMEAPSAHHQMLAHQHLRTIGVQPLGHTIPAGAR